MDKVRGFLTGIVFAAIAVGFAWAVPGAMTVSDVAPQATPQVENTHQPPKPEKTKEPEPEETEAPEQDDAEDEGGPTHGDAVSTAAHCELPPGTRGELVSSIAKDKDATVADAEAACAAAQAAAEAEGERAHGRANAHNEGKGKPEGKPGKGPKGSHDDDDEVESEDVSEGGSSEGGSSEGGPPADPGSNGNGNGPKG